MRRRAPVGEPPRDRLVGAHEPGVVERARDQRADGPPRPPRGRRTSRRASARRAGRAATSGCGPPATLPSWGRPGTRRHPAANGVVRRGRGIIPSCREPRATTSARTRPTACPSRSSSRRRRRRTRGGPAPSPAAGRRRTWTVSSSVGTHPTRSTTACTAGGKASANRTSAARRRRGAVAEADPPLDDGAARRCRSRRTRTSTRESSGSSMPWSSSARSTQRSGGGMSGASSVMPGSDTSLAGAVRSVSTATTASRSAPSCVSVPADVAWPGARPARRAP